jgi:hypothetical protein
LLTGWYFQLLTSDGAQEVARLKRGLENYLAHAVVTQDYVLAAVFQKQLAAIQSGKWGASPKEDDPVVTLEQTLFDQQAEPGRLQSERTAEPKHLQEQQPEAEVRRLQAGQTSKQTQVAQSQRAQDEAGSRLSSAATREETKRQVTDEKRRVSAAAKAAEVKSRRLIKEQAAIAAVRAAKDKADAELAVAEEAANRERAKQAEEEVVRAARRDERKSLKTARRKELELAEEAHREGQKKARTEQKAAQVKAAQRLEAEEARRLEEAAALAAAERARNKALREETQAFHSRIAQRKPPSLAQAAEVVSQQKSSPPQEGLLRSPPLRSPRPPLSAATPPSSTKIEGLDQSETTEDGEGSDAQPEDSLVVVPTSIKRFVAVEDVPDGPLRIIKERTPRVDKREALYLLIQKVSFYEATASAAPIHGGRDFDLCHEDLGMLTGLSGDSGLTEEKGIGGTEAANEVDPSNYAEQADAVTEIPLFTLAEVTSARLALCKQPMLPSPVVFESTELSRPVLQWLQSTAMEKKVSFVRCLEQIAEDPSVALHLLPGINPQKNTPPSFPIRSAPIVHGKLSMVWHQRPPDLVRESQSGIIVYYVVKPEKIVSAVDLINTSFHRMKSHAADTNGSSASGGAGGEEGVPEVRLFHFLKYHWRASTTFSCHLATSPCA